MRSVFLTIIGCFCALSLYTQNPMMKEFGTSWGEISTFLESRKCEVRQSGDKLIAQKGALDLEYHFQENVLYQITLSRSFEKKKDCFEAMNAFRQHYELIGAEMMEIGSADKGGAFAALHNGSLSEVSFDVPGKKQFQVTLIAQSLDYFPSEKVHLISEKINDFASAGSTGGAEMMP